MFIGRTATKVTVEKYIEFCAINTSPRTGKHWRQYTHICLPYTSRWTF